MLSENGNANGSFFMPVAPAYNSGGFGNGGFGGDWGWIILLLLFAGGGWGNGYGGFGGDGIYPWMNQANLTSNGFQNQMLNDNVTSIRDGIHEISTQLCNGFANVEQGANTRQMADMQQMFSLSQQLSQCCCNNQLATERLNGTILSENCADRQVINEGVRDLLTNQTANTQRILDQMCADKIDAKNEKIADLERQLTMANLAASQNAQTSRLLADNAAQTVALEQYLNPTPVPAYVVQNPACACNNNYGCGCNGGF